MFRFSVPFIAEHFFFKRDPIAAILSTFAAFAVAFGARPAGGLVFGYVGDKVGRIKMLSRRSLGGGRDGTPAVRGACKADERRKDRLRCKLDERGDRPEARARRCRIERYGSVYAHNQHIGPRKLNDFDLGNQACRLT